MILVSIFLCVWWRLKEVILDTFSIAESMGMIWHMRARHWCWRREHSETIVPIGEMYEALVEDPGFVANVSHAATAAKEWWSSISKQQQRRCYLFCKMACPISCIQYFIIVHRIVQCQSQTNRMGRLQFGSWDVKCFLIWFLSFIGSGCSSIIITHTHTLLLLLI